jgi:hypothetical protein
MQSLPPIKANSRQRGDEVRVFYADTNTGLYGGDWDGKVATVTKKLIKVDICETILVFNRKTGKIVSGAPHTKPLCIRPEAEV